MVVFPMKNYYTFHVLLQSSEPGVCTQPGLASNILRGRR